MPDIYFYMSVKEFNDVITYIFEQGAHFVPDDQYPTPEVTVLRTKAEFDRYASEQISLKFNILREDYVECPLKVSTIVKNDGRRIYYTSDRIGGPSIILAYWYKVNRGWCFYYPYYFYEEVEYWKHRPPEGLVNLYKDIFKYIRKRSVILKYYNRKRYCGPEYLQQVRDGIITEVDDDFKKLVMEYFDSREKK